eukprot:gene18914-20818_t
MAAIVNSLRQPCLVTPRIILASLRKTTSPAIAFEARRFLSEDKVTHTGQQFEGKDFRRARFVDKQKEVNPNFSEKLISEVPPKEVDSRVISCDGGGGALGHPKIYINLDQGVPESCGYCGLRFVKKAH